MTTTDRTDLVVDRLWVVNEPRVRARFDDVLEVLDSLDARHEADLPLGIKQARTLVDVLGVYGRPGPDLMQDIEQCLEKSATARAGDLARRVRQLLADLFRDQS